MPVTEITEIAEGRGGTSDVDGGRRYVRRFRVLTNWPYDGPNTVKAALGIRYGDRYQGLGLSGLEQDRYSYCTSIDAEQEDGDGLAWIVSVTYDWFDALTAGGGPDNNPLLVPCEIVWGYRSQERAIQADADGNAITNTAGDPFDPPLVVEDPRPVLTIVRNEATHDVVRAYNYRSAVNSDSFGPWGPRTARVIQISGRPAFHYQIGWYWIITYEFEFNPSGYRFRVLNLGTRKKSQALAHKDSLVPIIINGFPVTQPMMLTPAGYLAKPTDDPYFVDVKAYQELPFDVFAFDPIAVTGQRSGFDEGYGSG